MKRSEGNGPRARRVSVKRHPGVYFREGADGRRRYEITYRDSTGKRRWETVDGNLDDADAALADRRARMRGGEQLVRTTATLAEVAEAWLAAQTELRPRTREWYEGALDRHVLPRLGQRRIATISTDDVARLIAEMREGVYFVEREGQLVRARRSRPFAGWTIRGTLVPLSRLLAFAVRRGYIAANPVSRLEHGERPKVERREQRVLGGDEIGRLLDAALPTYRPLLATAVLTGLRLGELLGLVWGDVDFDAGLVRVRRQLDRAGRRVEPKTLQAVREVVLMPALAGLLRGHRSELRERLPAPIDRERDFVFASAAGTPFGCRNVERRGLDRAAARAGLNMDGAPKLRMHDLRHTFASLLIAEGANVVFVSRQLGHASRTSRCACTRTCSTGSSTRRGRGTRWRPASGAAAMTSQPHPIKVRCPQCGSCYGDFTAWYHAKLDYIHGGPAPETPIASCPDCGHVVEVDLPVLERKDYWMTPFGAGGSRA